MKDIYELLNDVDIDINEFEHVEVSKHEREQVKKELKKKIHMNKPSKWKKTMTAASIAIGISSASLFGLSFTTFAEEIPIIGGIFKLFNENGLYKEYDANANKLNLVKEGQGIKVTLNEAVFDGRALYVTYEIESEKDLGPSPEIIGFPEIKGSHTFFHAGKYEIKKTGDHQYVGMMTSRLLINGKGLSEGNFELNIEGFKIDSAIDGEQISGNWDFEFDLKTTKHHEQVVNLVREQKGITFNVTRITYTPMSFIVNYDVSISKEVDEKWDFECIDIKEVKDDLGNVYVSSWDGGYSEGDIFHYTYTLEKLNPGASKLIVIPIVRLLAADGTDERGNVYREENSSAPDEVFELEPIVIEIEK